VNSQKWRHRSVASFFARFLTGTMANAGRSTYIVVLLMATAVAVAFGGKDLRLWLGDNRQVIGHDRRV